ncbi:DoxX family protein [Peribacillus huizhouensis]|uniref:Thiosulfate dehydrogenase [quinone] large subunit n=1 Tax=Peribacillus huizhouensis TaxID=1501239 RepID=A0ABR6CU01_9BACI|nr:DoxX family protein [Peribacillus huizhouensis]MBA9028206.1 thiosulfate dehydrogenase [quinone] large subunit [Peribacillus huizhouensis]
MKRNWKSGPVISGVWTVLRVWLGIQWVMGGWSKLTSGEFNAGGFIQGAIANAGGDHPAVQGWYASFLENVALPNADLFSFFVQWGELLVGIGLILGVATIPALIAGAFMNLNFLLAGTVSTNPVYYTIAIILLFAGTGAYNYGVDRFVLPFIKAGMGKFKGKGKVYRKREIAH